LARAPTTWIIDDQSLRWEAVVQQPTGMWVTGGYYLNRSGYTQPVLVDRCFDDLGKQRYVCVLYPTRIRQKADNGVSMAEKREELSMKYYFNCKETHLIL